jgi:molybdopterin converting factor small subunit
MAALEIELFGVARARAGRELVELEAGSLGEALEALERSCPELAPEVLSGGALAAGYLASLNGDRFVTDPSTPLREGDRLLILSAQAGG